MNPRRNFTGVHDTRLCEDLDDRLQCITALGDLLGLARPDELADGTPLRIGQLIYRTAIEANDIAEEIWSRWRRAKAELEQHPLID